MPGLVGLITRMPRAMAEPQLRQMLKTVQHESFYVAGTWIDEEQGIYVGWTARAGSFDDAMPLHNESGNVTLVFSGEEFPEPGTASALRARGHVDHTRRFVLPGPSLRRGTGLSQGLERTVSRPGRRSGAWNSNALQ